MLLFRHAIRRATPRFEPALYAGVLSAALSLLVALRWHGLTEDQATLIVAAFTAVGQAVAAVWTRPVAPAVFTGVVTTVAALLMGFHFNVPPDVVAALNGLVLAAFAAWTRTQVSPRAGAVAP